jgi:hypothetical protein
MRVKHPIDTGWITALLCTLLCALAPHAEAAPERAAFDHLTTGFELIGQHRDLPCESCHVNSIFRGTPRDCASCHGVGTAVRASAKGQNHIVASTRCGACHTAEGWVPAVKFDHTEALGGCATCHNNVQAQGKGPQHMVTGLTCNACHSTIGWAGAAFMHRGISSGCASCHNGAQAPGPPANHIPTVGAPCEACHTSTAGFTSWVGPTMNHAAVAGQTCTTCHEAGDATLFFGVTIVTRPPPPHDATGDCGACHVTTSFAASASKPADHIPTSASCSQCHTTAGNFSAYVMGTTGHTGISNGCATCHASGLAFANMAPPTLVEPPPGPTGHIPTGTVACEKCHSTTNFSTFAGTVMVHAAVSGSTCETCHELGMAWKTNTGVQLWTRPDANHHAGQDCGGSGCHGPRDRRALRPGRSSPAAAPAAPAPVNAGAAGVPRTTVAGPSSATSSAPVSTGTAVVLGTAAPGSASVASAASSVPMNAGAATAPATAAAGHPPLTGALCVSCHRGALGKPAGHLLTTDACQACHRTSAWLPVIRVDHLHVRGACVSCHNGINAQRKSVMHIASGQQCESCHTTNGWTPARFEHAAAAAGRCAACHDSVHATGMPAAHIITHEPCDSCHGTLSWTPARMDHNRVAGAPCASCHNRVSATGKPATHMDTRADCGTCHRYPDWSAVAHRPPADRPEPPRPLPKRVRP